MMKDFTQYSIEDFAGNDDFIAWCRGIGSKVNWSNVAQEDVELAKRIGDAKDLVLMLPLERDDETEETEQLWQRIESTINSQSSPTKVRPMWRRNIAIAAAAIVIGLLVIPLFSPSDIYKTAAGEELTCTLPDQSTVLMDDESELRFDQDSWEDNRKVELSGRAFFDVEKGSRFEVVTSSGTVAVLGTSFSVECRRGTFEVRCQTGRVMVSAAGQEEILLPGDGALLSDRSLVKTSDSGIDWLDNIYRFSNVSLKTVFEELERQFDVRVDLAPGVGEQKFSGFFMDTDLEKALQDICWPKNLQWHLNGDTIIIEEESSL